MPTRLPNGLVLFNATPHLLHFYCGDAGVVTAESDGVINAIPKTVTVADTGVYTLNTVTFDSSVQGRELIDKFKQENRDALVVGSIIAAQAFPGEVVAPVPVKSARVDKHYRRVVRSDRFTIFQPEKENNNG